MQTQSSPIVAYRDHWTSECIALICGIANAGGGTLVIESSEKAYTTGRRKLRRPFEQIPKLVEKELGLQCTTDPCSTARHCAWKRPFRQRQNPSPMTARTGSTPAT